MYGSSKALKSEANEPSSLKVGAAALQSKLLSNSNDKKQTNNAKKQFCSEGLLQVGVEPTTFASLRKNHIKQFPAEYKNDTLTTL